MWEEIMLVYLSEDIICSEKRTVFRKRSSRKPVGFEEQIMSKDKYPSIISPQMEAIVFIILQIFLNKAAQFWIPFWIRFFHPSHNTSCLPPKSFTWELF